VAKVRDVADGTTIYAANWSTILEAVVVRAFGNTYRVDRNGEWHNIDPDDDACLSPREAADAFVEAVEEENGLSLRQLRSRLDAAVKNREEAE
jgi:ATP-dependent DNA ligase